MNSFLNNLPLQKAVVRTINLIYVASTEKKKSRLFWCEREFIHEIHTQNNAWK